MTNTVFLALVEHALSIFSLSYFSLVPTGSCQHEIFDALLVFVGSISDTGVLPDLYPRRFVVDGKSACHTKLARVPE